MTTSPSTHSRHVSLGLSGKTGGGSVSLPPGCLALYSFHVTCYGNRDLSFSHTGFLCPISSSICRIACLHGPHTCKWGGSRSISNPKGLKQALSCHRGRLHHPTEPHPPEDCIFFLNKAVACIPFFFKPNLSLQLIVARLIGSVGKHKDVRVIKQKPHAVRMHVAHLQ